MGALPSLSMAPLSLSEWLERLESQHPVEIELGLDRVSDVAQNLGLLSSPPTTLTVAGTNGKGSVVTVLSAALVHSGKRVGRYTSPHLNRFNERICIDDVELPDAELIAAFEALEDRQKARLNSLVASMDLSFEMLDADAVEAFVALSLFPGGLPEQVARRCDPPT